MVCAACAQRIVASRASSGGDAVRPARSSAVSRVHMPRMPRASAMDTADVMKFFQ